MRQRLRLGAVVAHRAGRGPRHPRSDAGAYLCGAHRLLVHLRQAVRYRREAKHRPAAGALGQETSEDGKTVTIKLRPNVKFHDGEPMDAEAVKFSLERHLTMQGSFRKPELAAVDKIEVADPLTVRLLLKAPFSPLIAQLSDRAGMIVSPKVAQAAGDKFGLESRVRRPVQVRRAHPAGSHRRREVCRLLEQRQRIRRPHRLSADRGIDSAPGQPKVRQPRHHRACARHRPERDQGATRSCAWPRKPRSDTKA